jgi:hypothetical protein
VGNEVSSAMMSAPILAGRQQQQQQQQQCSLSTALPLAPRVPATSAAALAGALAGSQHHRDPPQPPAHGAARPTALSAAASTTAAASAVNGRRQADAAATSSIDFGTSGAGAGAAAADPPVSCTPEQLASKALAALTQARQQLPTSCCTACGMPGSSALVEAMQKLLEEQQRVHEAALVALMERHHAELTDVKQTAIKKIKEVMTAQRGAHPAPRQQQH